MIELGIFVTYPFLYVITLVSVVLAGCCLLASNLTPSNPLNNALKRMGASLRIGYARIFMRAGIVVYN